MLDSLREAGKSIGRELNRAWESLSDGWRELLSRCSNALVHFERSGNGNDDQFPRWSLMNASRTGVRLTDILSAISCVLMIVPGLSSMLTILSRRVL